jgi:hypothetical protein
MLANGRTIFKKDSELRNGQREFSMKESSEKESKKAKENTHLLQETYT